jgi:outer membrane protein OmpA-like peptidoglycan-associated protein
MSDLFISYSRKDRSMVEQLAAALEARGWSLWWDHRIGAGNAFDRQIEQAIQESRLVVVVWSQRSIESDWVRAEASYALENNKLLPILIDDAKLPLRFINTHTLPFGGWDGSDTAPAFHKLATEIAGLIGGEARPDLPAKPTEIVAAEPAPPPPLSKPGMKRSVMALAAAGAAVVLLGIGGVAYQRAAPTVTVASEATPSAPTPAPVSPRKSEASPGVMDQARPVAIAPSEPMAPPRPALGNTMAANAPSLPKEQPKPTPPPPAPGNTMAANALSPPKEQPKADPPPASGSTMAASTPPPARADSIVVDNPRPPAEHLKPSFVVAAVAPPPEVPKPPEPTKPPVLPASVPPRPVEPPPRSAVAEPIFFEKGKVVLSAVAQSTIEKQVAFLNDHPTMLVRIEGHSREEEGSRGTLRGLAELRAYEVRRALTQRGVDAARLTVAAHVDDPAAGESSDARAPRVVLVTKEQ